MGDSEPEFSSTSKRLKISELDKETEEVYVPLYQQTRLEGNKTNLTVLHQIADDENHEDYYEALHIIRGYSDRTNFGYGKVSHDGLFAIAQNPDHPKQINAAQILRYHGTPESAPIAFDILKTIATDDNHPLQAKALLSLFKGVEPQYEFNPILKRIAEDPTHPQQIKGADYLAYTIHNNAMIEALRVSFENEDHPYRLNAASILKRDGTPVDEVMVNDYLCAVLQDMDDPHLFEATFPVFSWRNNSDEEKAQVRPGFYAIARDNTHLYQFSAVQDLWYSNDNTEDKAVAREALVELAYDEMSKDRWDALDLLMQSTTAEDKEAARSILQETAKHNVTLHSILSENFCDEEYGAWSDRIKAVAGLSYDKDPMSQQIAQWAKKSMARYRQKQMDALETVVVVQQ